MWYDDWKGADYRCLLHLQLLTVSGMWYGDVFIHLSSTFKLLANKRRKIMYILIITITKVIKKWNLNITA